MSEVDAADHIEDEVVGAVKVAAATGAYAGMQLARMRQENAQRAQEQSAAAARLDAQRQEAMWQESRSELLPVMDEQWWDKASAEEIGRAYQTATAWEGREEAAPFADRIRDQVRERYGVDLEQLRPEDAATTDNARDSDREREAGEKDRAEAERLMKDANEAEAAEREDRADGDPLNAEKSHDVSEVAAEDSRAMYDSAERRESFAQDLNNRGVPQEAVDSRVRADVGQGSPSPDAARSNQNRPKARKGRGANQQRQRDRSRQR